MVPSSLIFLVLVAIWAAYLLQHWVRRREHLATARSVDRFSDAMRVLERRAPLPEFELSGPRPRSYDISPARPSRPEVVAKRAHPVRPEVPEPLETPSPEAGVRPTRVFRVLAGVSARRLRGLSLLVSLALVLAVPILVVLSVLPWWSILAVVAALVVDVLALRHAAVAARARGRAEAQARGEAAGHGAAPQPDYFESAAESGTSLFDSEAQPEREAPVAGAAPGVGSSDTAVEVDPSGWAPVPVPPPTYTLKAKAADPVAVAVVVDEPGEDQSWSLDGLVYDCDLDELVERRRATGA